MGRNIEAFTVTCLVCSSGFMLVAGTPGHAKEGGVETRYMVGASIDPAPHGVLDLGIRKNDWSAQILTDTLDLRWAPESDRGRAWVAVRGEYSAVALLHSPWDNGEPAPEQGFAGAYVGGEGGAVRYLSRGFYAGASGFGYYTSFSATPNTEVEVPAPTPWLGVDGVFGWWSPHTHAWARLGLQHDQLGEVVQPHAHLTVTSAAEKRWGHRAELRAGWASGQSVLTSTRVGGLNPYVVPIAGAGWAEWWAESYAVARLGPQFCASGSTNTWTHSVVADIGFVDDIRTGAQTLAGAGLLHRLDREKLFVQADLGWGFGLVRPSGAVPVTGWILVGRPWT
jgi:hypothetical protein